MSDHVRPPRLAGRLLGLGWRLRRAVHWCLADLGALMVQAVARVPLLRRFPRLVLIPAERVLIGFRGMDLFDPEFYLAQNPDVRQAGVPPLDHYLRHGWQEGRAPNAHFDDGHYRAEAGLVRGAPVSALAHFLALGKTQSLWPVPGIDLSHQANRGSLAIARMDPYREFVTRQAQVVPPVPSIDEVRLRLETISPPSVPPVVDVIVPVYLGRAETLNTILHVLRATCRIGFEIVVVNDATPDAALAGDLRHLADGGLITLIEHETNRGFVASINTGCALHPTRDTVWLNADTEVYDGWIDRLRAAARDRAKVASVTPLTNNGTICSYPRFNADNPGTLETSWEELDRLAARFNAGVRVETPTGVGFCMYVPRRALVELGLLDTAAFGRGYGEENDFCQRAIGQGWCNLVAADVVVRHFGATSFKDSRADRVEAALKVIDRRHPGYRAQVRAFIAADPLRPHRRALDLARLSTVSGARNMLMVTHARGGGTHQHVQEETARLNRDGWSVYVLSRGAGGPGTASLSHADAGALPQLMNLSLESDWLWKALTILRISAVQIHHLIDYTENAPDLFRERLTSLGLPYTFVVHDYFTVCPRINMADRRGVYCGEPGLSACQSCVERRGSAFAQPDVRAWRGQYHLLLSNAQAVKVPDADVAERLRAYFPDLRNVTVVPHEDPPAAHPGGLRLRKPGPVRVAVIGAIGPIKGFDSLLGLAHHLQQKKLPGDLHLLGYSRADQMLENAGVHVTGPYLNDQIEQLIEDVDPDLIWIPSLWPETYCYTLSIALRTGRPIAAFAIGALVTRLRAADTGRLLPLSHAFTPERLWPALELVARGGEASVPGDLRLAS